MTENETANSLVRDLESLRDDVTVYMMDRYKGNSRELAMVLTKLDEARLWLVEEAVKIRRLSIVDRASILRTAASEAEKMRTDTTDTTDERETANV